jgi:hypothetical protein
MCVNTIPNNKTINLCTTLDYTGCGRKNSSIWEANEFKIKEDTANTLLFLESTQNAVLHQCVLNKHHSSGGLEY